MKPEFEPGQLWLTGTLRTVEIVAADTVESEDEVGITDSVDVIAYRFVGGSVVHLRGASRASNWQKINEG